MYSGFNDKKNCIFSGTKVNEILSTLPTKKHPIKNKYSYLKDKVILQLQKKVRSAQLQELRQIKIF